MTDLETININGVSYDIIERQHAKWDRGDGNPVEVSTIDELLLNDGSVVFVCVNKQPVVGKTPCAPFTGPSIRTVMAHQKSHSVKTAAKKATAELERKAAEEAAEFARRSAGINAANEAKRKRYAGEVTATDKRIASIQRKLSDLAAGVDKITSTLPPIAAAIRALNEELATITPPEAKVDPEIAEKAAAYDMLKGILNK